MFHRQTTVKPNQNPTVSEVCIDFYGKQISWIFLQIKAKKNNFAMPGVMIRMCMHKLLESGQTFTTCNMYKQRRKKVVLKRSIDDSLSEINIYMIKVQQTICIILTLSKNYDTASSQNEVIRKILWSSINFLNQRWPLLSQLVFDIQQFYIEATLDK